MAAGVQAATNPCRENIFVHAYRECWYNVRDAVLGTKINLVAQNALPDGAAAPAEKDLSIGERVTALAIGILLFVPIVNMLALAILRHNNSDFLHIQPVIVKVPNPVPAPNPMPAPNPVQLANPPPAPNPNEPNMRQRREEAFERLEEIEALIIADGRADQFLTLANEHFKCATALVQFNVDAFLNERYATNAHPIGLARFRDWADVENDNTWRDNDPNLENVWGLRGRKTNGENYLTPVNRQNYERRRCEWFENKINEYSNENPNNRRFDAVRDRLRNILAYFTQERPRVAPGSAEETALKERFRTFYKNFIDATHNCIDQVISQIETYAIDVAVQANRSTEIPLQQRLFNQACLALHNHRKELITGILVLQDTERARAIVEAAMNRNDHRALELAIQAGFDVDDGFPEHEVRNMLDQVRRAPPEGRLQIFQGRHMADWQRLAMRQIAQQLNLQGAMVRLGPEFHNDGVARARVNAAIPVFTNQYKPEEYLLRGIAEIPQNNNPEGDLRAAANLLIMQWAIQYFALQNEDPNGPQLDRRLAFDPGNGFDTITMGGGITAAGVTLMMEKAGLIVPRAYP